MLGVADALAGYTTSYKSVIRHATDSISFETQDISAVIHSSLVISPSSGICAYNDMHRTYVSCNQVITSYP